MPQILGYVGTYASPDHSGTYQFQLDTDTGLLSHPQNIYHQANTKYSSCYQGLVATLTEKDPRAGLALIDAAAPDHPLLDSILTEKVTGCYLVWHNGLIYTTNYHDGHVLIYDPSGGSLILRHRLLVGEEAGCHQVIFHDHYLLVPCLCLDQIRIFDLDANYAQVGQIDFPAGTGPRHGVFNADHTKLFVVSETTNQLFTYQVNGLTFDLQNTIDLLSGISVPNAQSAAIRLSEDEKTLYISIRGANLIVILRADGLQPQILQYADSLGQDPWDLVLVPGSSLLLVSNRKSNELACFETACDGQITRRLSAISIYQCVGISLDR